MQPQVNLSLATLNDNDIDFIVDIKTNADLWKFEDDISSDKESTRKIVINRMEGDWYKQYIIQLNNDEMTPIGEFHIHYYVKERESWEIGYCILPEYQGYGYCIEAARLILKYAFNDLGAHKVVAMCNEYNHASYHIMEKIGMTREAVFREELPWNGKWVNQFFYCILEHEYTNDQISIQQN